jgi:hypothetical protein
MTFSFVNLSGSVLPDKKSRRLTRKPVKEMFFSIVPSSLLSRPQAKMYAQKHFSMPPICA